VKCVDVINLCKSDHYYLIYRKKNN